VEGLSEYQLLTHPEPSHSIPPNSLKIIIAPVLTSNIEPAVLSSYSNEDFFYNVYLLFFRRNVVFAAVIVEFVYFASGDIK